MNTPRWLVVAILSLSSGFALFARAVAAADTLTVPIAGTAFGLPESVYFSGTAKLSVKPTSIRLPGAKRRLVVSIDLHGISGRGLSTGATYLATAEANLTRPFGPSDVVELTFPFAVAGSPATAVGRTAVAIFNFTYDPSTGALTAATASVAALKLAN
jgi:hypothetical protein